MSSRRKKKSDVVVTSNSDRSDTPSTHSSKSYHEMHGNKALSQYAAYKNGGEKLGESTLIKGAVALSTICDLTHIGVYYYCRDVFNNVKVTSACECGSEENFHLKVKSFDGIDAFDPYCDALIYVRRDQRHVTSQTFEDESGRKFTANVITVRRFGIVNNNYPDRDYVSLFTIRNKDTLQEEYWAINMSKYLLPVSFWGILADSCPSFRGWLKGIGYDPFILSVQHFVHVRKDRRHSVINLFGESSSDKEKYQIDDVTY